MLAPADMLVVIDPMSTTGVHDPTQLNESYKSYVHSPWATSKASPIHGPVISDAAMTATSLAEPLLPDTLAPPHARRMRSEG
eukprot:CAMPEP_0174751890 /NCGR_PEP_ID=MMETSP1094-20130205/100798_1 /TAXON_ID=156173 /ORGANISM="Chrysochromulina brevifilum, Strain UTEX LB 985" /LENGTH=81 /DNA_ID=CAMNT_0015957445 /DNA_START=6 /DNA_END=251 /DNA_ORIENTATION=+